MDPSAMLVLVARKGLPTFDHEYRQAGMGATALRDPVSRSRLSNYLPVPGRWREGLLSPAN